VGVEIVLHQRGAEAHGRSSPRWVKPEALSYAREGSSYIEVTLRQFRLACWAFVTPMTPVTDVTVAEEAFVALLRQEFDCSFNEVPIVASVKVSKVAARCDLFPQERSECLGVGIVRQVGPYFGCHGHVNVTCLSKPGDVRAVRPMVDRFALLDVQEARHLDLIGYLAGLHKDIS